MSAGQQKVLIIGATSITSWGNDQLRRLTAQAAARGLQCVGLDTPANLSRSPSEVALFTATLPADPDSVEACLAAAAGIDGLSAVVTIRELSVAAVAAVARAHGLAGNDPEVVQRIRNKDECRERLRQAGFRQPRVRLCSTAHDAAAASRDLGAPPWIVKPRDGMASLGVSQVDTVEEFGVATAGLVGRPFIVEEFVHGSEYSADGVMVGGHPLVLSLTQKAMGDHGAAQFVEMGHRVPAELPESDCGRLVDELAKAIEVAGLTHGIFHVEFWLDGDDGLVVGEMHDRPGGDYIAALLELTRPGLQLYGTLLDDLLAHPPAPAPPTSRCAATQFFAIPPGTVTSLQGWADVLAAAGVEAADLQIRTGDVVDWPTGSYDRPGLVVVSGADHAEVDRRTRTALELLQVCVQDAGGTVSCGPPLTLAERTVQQ